MRKHILFYALLILCNLSLTAQNYRGESWYRNYFKEHIEELDPIEGIYSANVRMIIPGVAEDFSTNIKLVIVKEGGFYAEYSLEQDGDSSPRNKYTKVGETNTYNYKWVWNASDYSEGRVCMESLFGFDYSLKKTKGRSTITIKQNYVKEFPTRSMYEKAIANAQRKIEEESQPSSWSGSGWALGAEYLVTNHHVIDGARIISVKGIGGDLNTGYSAEVVASDKTNDIAVLRITDSRFKGFGAIPYAVSSRIADKGEGIFVLGYPMTQVLGNEVKYTAGEINSRTGFQGDVATYQISAPVTHGNSGGPMFDNKGNVIGIVNSGITDKEIAENVGYAIKISYLKILIESAGLNITLPNNNTISSLSKQEKIKKVEKFVYYIECSK